jgi:hypothetical protein
MPIQMRVTSINQSEVGDSYGLICEGLRRRRTGREEILTMAYLASEDGSTACLYLYGNEAKPFTVGAIFNVTLTPGKEA